MKIIPWFRYSERQPCSKLVRADTPEIFNWEFIFSSNGDIISKVFSNSYGDIGFPFKEVILILLKRNLLLHKLSYFLFIQKPAGGFIKAYYLI